MTTTLTSSTQDITATQTTPASTTEPEPPVLRGDVNLDNAITVADAQIALIAYTEQFAGNPVGLTDRQLRAADVNSNGALSVDDAQNILIYYTERTVAGNDLTWDDLLGIKPQGLPLFKRLAAFFRG